MVLICLDNLKGTSREKKKSKQINKEYKYKKYMVFLDVRPSVLIM